MAATMMPETEGATREAWRDALGIDTAWFTPDDSAPIVRDDDAEWAALESAYDAPERVPCIDGKRHRFAVANYTPPDWKHKYERNKKGRMVKAGVEYVPEQWERAGDGKPLRTESRNWDHETRSYPVTLDPDRENGQGWSVGAFICEHCGKGVQVQRSRVRQTDGSARESFAFTAKERKLLVRRPVTFKHAPYLLDAPHKGEGKREEAAREQFAKAQKRADSIGLLIVPRLATRALYE